MLSLKLNLNINLRYNNNNECVHFGSLWRRCMIKFLPVDVPFLHHKLDCWFFALNIPGILVEVDVDD